MVNGQPIFGLPWLYCCLCHGTPFVDEIQGLGFQIMVNPGLAGLPRLPYSGTPKHLSSNLLKLTTTFMLIFLNLLNYVLLFLDWIDY